MITFICILSIGLLLACIYYRGICVKQNRMIDCYAKRRAVAEFNYALISSKFKAIKIFIDANEFRGKKFKT